MQGICQQAATELMELKWEMMCQVPRIVPKKHRERSESDNGVINEALGRLPVTSMTLGSKVEVELQRIRVNHRTYYTAIAS